MTTNVGVDPRTGAAVGPGVPSTTAGELDAILGAATAATRPFGASSPVARAGLLRALARRLELEESALVELAGRETGLPVPRLAGEVARTAFQLHLFAEVVEEGSYLEAMLDTPDPTATPPRPELRRMLEAIGPVLIFAASNFPFAFSVLGGDTASALAAGCPVVVKAHGSHPGLSERVGLLANDVVSEFGLPAGVFAVIHGVEAGSSAIVDSRISACGFTGSTGGGRALFDLAAARPDPIPFYGELGSVNPTVVTPDAVADRGAQIAAEFVASFTLGVGQFCTKPGLLFLPRDHGLETLLSQGVSALKPAPMLNSRIREQFDSGVATLADHEGVRPLATVPADEHAGSWGSPCLFVTNTGAFSMDPTSLSAEYFGPSSLVVEYDGADDLLTALAQVEGSLTATVHAQHDDSFDVAAVVEILRSRAGRIIWNGWPTGVAVTWAMQHGGPWPSSTASGHTSVGATAIRRWLRPVSYQDLPSRYLPPPLQDTNPWNVPRRINGRPEL